MGDTGGQLNSPLQVDSSGKIYVVSDGVTGPDGSQVLLGILDLLGPFECGEQPGPDLIRPRSNLRIIPGKVSGEPHLSGSRITTQVAAALYENLGDVEKVADLYPGIDIRSIDKAIQFEYSLAA